MKITKITTLIIFGVCIATIIPLESTNGAAEGKTDQIKILKLEEKVSVLQADLDKRQQLDDHYLKVLESTNNQLSSNLNPYSIMVSVLSAFLGILAIFAAIVMYQTGAERKKELKEERETREKKLIEERETREKDYKEFFIAQETAMKQYTAEWIKAKEEMNVRIEESKTMYDKLISEHVARLSKANADEKENLQKTILSLKKRKANVAPTMYKNFTHSNKTQDASSPQKLWIEKFSLNADRGVRTFRKCDSCGVPYPTRILIGKEFVENKNCLSCGHVN